jgi:EEF1A lysine methyltransferase 2
LDNFAENPTDEGTIWFSESNAEEKVRSKLSELSQEGELHKAPRDEIEATSFLDLGTGNGHMLLALRESGWKGRMLGIDYSVPSVKLAENIEQKWRAGEIELDVDVDSDDEGEEEADTSSGRLPVEFKQADILSNEPHPWLGDGFDVVLDKGTFDAISLSGQQDADGHRLNELYQAKVEKMVKPGGLLVVVSCNWTEDELRSWLAKGQLEECDRVEYPSFQFGGQKGSQICTLLFRRKTI